MAHFQHRRRTSYHLKRENAPHARKTAKTDKFQNNINIMTAIIIVMATLLFAAAFIGGGCFTSMNRELRRRKRASGERSLFDTIPNSKSKIPQTNEQN